MKLLGCSFLCSFFLFISFLFFSFFFKKNFNFQGVCIGLSEVMASAGKSQLLSFMDELIPTIRTALCDRFVMVLCLILDMLIISSKLVTFHYLTNHHDFIFVNSTPEVRESAGLAFSTLYKVLIVLIPVFWFSSQFYV